MGGAWLVCGEFSFPLRWFSVSKKCQTGLSEKKQLLVGDSAKGCHLLLFSAVVEVCEMTLK